MIMMLFIFVVLLFSLYVFSPLFTRVYRTANWNVISGKIENLILQKQQILTALNDLEYDKQLNKIALVDYQQVKDQLMQEGAAILKAIHLAEQPLKPQKHSKRTAA